MNIYICVRLGVIEFEECELQIILAEDSYSTLKVAHMEHPGHWEVECFCSSSEPCVLYQSYNHG